MSPDNNNRRRNIGTAAGLLAAGAVAGGVLAGTLSAGAASPSPTPSSNGAPSGPAGAPADGDHGRGGPRLALSGTVTGVNADGNGTTGTVSINTSSGTHTYTVNGNSDIDKNGESQLSKLAAGDKVTFSVSGTAIDILHAGNESLNAPAGHDGHRGGGGHGHGLPLSGTVTAVNPDSNGTTGSVTIKTPSGSKTYVVDNNSDVDKNGESKLSKLSVGDAVTFSLSGTTIDRLHAGDEAKDAPAPPTSVSSNNA
jgi:hypothetical protein